MPLNVKLNIAGALNSVSGWTDQAAGAGFFPNSDGSSYYTDALDFDGQLNTAPEAVYRSVLFWVSSYASAATLSGLTAGVAYVCRLHFWNPAGFSGTNSIAFDANVDGGANITVNVPAGKVRTYDIPFTAAGATAQLNFLVNAASLKLISGVEIIDAAPPGDTTAPTVTSFTATANSSSQITAAYAATDAVGVTGWDLDWSPDGSTGWAALLSNVLTASPYAHTGRAASTAYYYRFRARDAAGNVSAYSYANATTSAAAVGDTTAPVVTSFTATTNSSTQITIAYSTTDAVGVTGWDLDYSFDGTTGWTPLISNLTTPSPVVSSGLTPSTQYFFRFRARDAAGNVSPYSYANATTSATTTVFTVTPDKLTDNIYGINLGDYLFQSPFARLVIDTNATQATVKAWATMYSTYPTLSQIAVYVDSGSGFVFKEYLTCTANGLNTFTPTFAAGTKKIAFVGGPQAEDGYNNIEGTFLKEVTVNSLTATVYHPTVTRKIVVYGTSLENGFFSSGGRYGWIQLLRDAHSDWSIMVEAWGSRTLHRDAGNPAKLTALINNFITADPDVIIIAGLPNDFLSQQTDGLIGQSAVNYGIEYAALLDRIRGALPNAFVICETQRVTSLDATPNAYGNTAEDYRYQVRAKSAARARFAVSVPGEQIRAASDTSDGIHDTNAGYAKTFAFFNGILGFYPAPAGVVSAIDFDEVEISRYYSEAAKGGPEFYTTIYSSPLGAQQRNAARYDPVHKFDLVYRGEEREEAFRELLDFFFTRRGGAIGFRFLPPYDRDWDNELMALSVTGQSKYNLIRTYSIGGQTYVRRIVKPVLPITVTVGGADAIAYAPYFVDYTKGQIIFLSPAALPGGAEIRVTGQYCIPVVFDTDNFEATSFVTYLDIDSLKVAEILPVALGIDPDSTD